MSESLCVLYTHAEIYVCVKETKRLELLAREARLMPVTVITGQFLEITVILIQPVPRTLSSHSVRPPHIVLHLASLSW